MKPNIFSYATSELSQDALICYVASFYSNDYREYSQKNFPKEYEFSKIFIEKLLEKVQCDNIVIDSLKIYKQHYKIDVLLEINESIYIIVEDKIHTGESKDQIKNYIDKLASIEEKNILPENIYALYYKTGDESYQNIKNKETYAKEKNLNLGTFLREEIIELFSLYSGENLIIKDYLENLKKMQLERENFKVKDLRTNYFTWNEINGFYHELDKIFKDFNQDDNSLYPSNWGYTSNPSGGFMCYYFEGIWYDDYGYYLQLEYNPNNKKNEELPTKEILHKKYKLAIKVSNDKKGEKRIDKYKSLGIIQSNEVFNGNVEKTTFRDGRWMTLGIITNYIVLQENGTIDSIETALNIKKYLDELTKLKDELSGLNLS